MRERETPSDRAEEAGHRRIPVIGWILTVVASFALGAVATHFALIQEPVSQISFQAFFMGPFWATASIALVCFVLGLGFAYLPFSWYRADANRALRTEYQDLRQKTDELRERADTRRGRADAVRARPPGRAVEPDEASQEPQADGDGEGPQDIAAVISEMSAAIKANLGDAGASRPVDVDLRLALRSKPGEEVEEPPYAKAAHGAQDIGSAISEMNAAIKANLRDPGPARAAEGDLRRAPRSKPSDE